MMLAGYTGGISNPDNEQVCIGSLHHLQIAQTADGLRSLPTEGGRDVAGYLWFDTSRLGKRHMMRDIWAWQPTLDALLSYLFWAACDRMESTDCIGIVVTWTTLTGQIQRRYAPAGRGTASRAEASYQFSPKQVAVDFANRRLNAGLTMRDKVSIHVWHRIFVFVPGPHGRLHSGRHGN